MLGNDIRTDVDQAPRAHAAGSRARLRLTRGSEPEPARRAVCGRIEAPRDVAAHRRRAGDVQREGRPSENRQGPEVRAARVGPPMALCPPSPSSAWQRVGGVLDGVVLPRASVRSAQAASGGQRCGSRDAERCRLRPDGGCLPVANLPGRCCGGRPGGLVRVSLAECRDVIR